jgi:hypothetical protein
MSNATIKIVIEVTRTGDEFHAEVLPTDKGRAPSIVVSADTPGFALKALGERIDQGLIAQAWSVNESTDKPASFA